MSCWRRQLTEEEKRLSFLLCPLKSFTSPEQKLFSLAALCDPWSWKHTTSTHGEYNPSSDCCHESRSSSSDPDSKYIQHNKNAAMQEVHETSAACSFDSRSCQIKTETPTKTDEDEHRHRSHVDSAHDSNESGVLTAAVDSSSLKCHTNNCTKDTGLCTTSVSLFKPLPYVPSLMFQQNYSKWKAVMDNHFRLRQIRHHNTIYIQPLDEFPEFIYSSIGSNTDTVCGTTVGGFFELLGEYMKVFFSGLNVIIQPAVKTTGTGWKVQSRYHHMTGKKQLLVGDVHEGLKKILPKDGCCVVGITWTDLYPCEDLNFVLGEATVEHRCAAFCFGRYEPKCYVDGKVPAQIENIDGFIIWKMLKVISHETCHIFNLGHCVHFKCLMNESSSLTQMLEQPNFLCPVCLCKLKKVARCNIVHRYQQLLKFYEDVYKLYPSTFMHDAIAWLKGVLTFLE